MLSQLERYAEEFFKYDHAVLAVRLGSRTPRGEFSECVGSEFYASALAKLNGFRGWDGVVKDTGVDEILWDSSTCSGSTVRGPHVLITRLHAKDSLNITHRSDGSVPSVFRVEAYTETDVPCIATAVTCATGLIRTEFKYMEWSIVCYESTDTRRIAVELRDPSAYVRRVGTEQAKCRVAASFAGKINGLFDDVDPFT